MFDLPAALSSWAVLKPLWLIDLYLGEERLPLAGLQAGFHGRVSARGQRLKSQRL